MVVVWYGGAAPPPVPGHRQSFTNDPVSPARQGMAVVCISVMPPGRMLEQ